MIIGYHKLMLKEVTEFNCSYSPVPKGSRFIQLAQHHLCLTIPKRVLRKMMNGLILLYPKPTLLRSRETKWYLKH